MGRPKPPQEWRKNSDGIKEDVSSGDLSLTYWGTQEHYSTQVEVEWGYRFSSRRTRPHAAHDGQLSSPLDGAIRRSLPDRRRRIQALCRGHGSLSTTIRYLVDYGEGPTGIYSDSKVKQVAWVKHYEKFWIGAGGFCGWRWPMCITNNTADRRGATPQAETKFWNAVTGKNLTFADCMEIGPQDLHS